MPTRVSAETSTITALYSWLAEYSVPKNPGEAFITAINDQGYTTVAALKTCPLHTILRYFDESNNDDDVPLKGGRFA